MATETKKKAIWLSLTAWGAVLLAALQGAEGVGIVPPDTSSGTLSLVQALGQLLVILGIRRAIKSDIAHL